MLQALLPQLLRLFAVQYGSTEKGLYLMAASVQATKQLNLAEADLHGDREKTLYESCVYLGKARRNEIWNAGLSAAHEDVIALALGEINHMPGTSPSGTIQLPQLVR